MRLSSLTVAPSNFQVGSMVTLTAEFDVACTGTKVLWFCSTSPTRANSTGLGESVVSIGRTASTVVEIGSAISNLANLAQSKAERSGGLAVGRDLDKIKSLYFIAFSPDSGDSVVAECGFYPHDVQFWPSDSVVTSSMPEGETSSIEGESLFLPMVGSAPGGSDGVSFVQRFGLLIVVVVFVVFVVVLCMCKFEKRKF